MRSPSCRLPLLVCVVAIAVASLSTTDARAQRPAELLVDRVVVRFIAPETGGVARPMFITERQLAFEARLEWLMDPAEPLGPRQVRGALDVHVAASLLEHLRLDRPLPEGDRRRLRDAIRRAVFERVGGEAQVRRAAEAEGLDDAEVGQVMDRLADAAIYVDRAISPILTPSEEQLREVYRTAAHPYRSLPFGQAREPLGRWFMVERLRVAMGAYLQGARARVKVQVVGG